MTLTIYGKALPALAIATRTSLIQGRDRPELHRAHRHYTADQLRPRQPRGPLTLDHDAVIGRLAAIEVAPDNSVWIAAIAERAHLELLRDAQDWFYSLEDEALNGRDGGREDVLITGCSLVRDPALGRAALGPIKILAGDLASASTRRSWRLPSVHAARLERAARTLNDRDLIVHRTAAPARGGAPPLHRADAPPAGHAAGARPVGALRHGPPSPILAVR